MQHILFYLLGFATSFFAILSLVSKNSAWCYRSFTLTLACIFTLLLSLGSYPSALVFAGLYFCLSVAGKRSIYAGQAEGATEKLFTLRTLKPLSRIVLVATVGLASVFFVFFARGDGVLGHLGVDLALSKQCLLLTFFMFFTGFAGLVTHAGLGRVFVAVNCMLCCLPLLAAYKSSLSNHHLFSLSLVFCSALFSFLYLLVCNKIHQTFKCTSTENLRTLRG